MATFEAAIAASLEELCIDCPARSLCDKVLLERMERQMEEEAEPSPVQAASEADAAADIVLVGVFKSIIGCDGPAKRDHACEDCGRETICPAYIQAYELLAQNTDGSEN